MRHHIERISNVCGVWCRQWRIYDRVLPTAFLFGVLCFLLYFLTIAPPLDYPSATLMRVKPGEPLANVAQELQARHIIRSKTLFTMLLAVYGVNRRAYAGEYFFPGPQNIFTIARRIARGDYELVPVRVRLPEGSTVRDIATILGKKIPDFDVDTFLTRAQGKEGRLFPDTYFFLPGEEPETAIFILE